MTNKEKTELQKEIVDSLDPKPHGRLLLAPRVGKTKIGIDIIKREKPDSILWVTPSAELAEEDIPKEFETWKAKRFLNKLTTVTWMSLNKITGHFGLIILDEEQFATENNLETLLNGELTADFIIAMTGTPTKHKEKIELYKKLGLDILYDMSINEAVDIGLLNNYSINVLEVALGTEKNIEAGSKDNRFMTSEQKNYEYLHKVAQQAIYQKRRDTSFRIMARRRAILDSPAKDNAAKWLFNHLEGRRKVIFASSIKQAEEVSNYTYHSKTDNVHLRQFKNGEVDELAMVNAGGTGHTYKAIDDLILVQADSDKNGLTSQKICRTLLKQKDYHATIWILCLIGTQDEKWVASTLESFDKTKITYTRFVNLINQNQLL